MNGVKLLIALLPLTAALATTPTLAAKDGDSVIGPAFVKTCVSPAPDHAAVKAGVAGDGGWASVPVPENFRVRGNWQDSDMAAFSRVLDGRNVLLVTISAPNSGGLTHNCIFLIEDKRSLSDYMPGFTSALQSLGLKLSRSDSNNHSFYAGKLAGGQPVQIDLHGKSASLPGKRALHMAIAY
jgi:hypothetical protein